jgi:O-antigen ligase
MVVPAYVFLCLLMGGSAQGIWQMAILEFVAILMIAWSFSGHSHSREPKLARNLFWLAAGAMALLAIQLIPIPAAIWAALPGRSLVAEGRSILGLQPGWSSLSLAPYDSLAAMLSLLPPFAVLVAIFRRNTFSSFWLSAAVCAATLCGVGLGALQTSGPDPLNSPWYPYPISNFGVATGFFANSNHMASLLIVAIPFTMALIAHARKAIVEPRKQRAIIALGGAALAVLLVGIALNGSLMGFGLVLPVTIVSALMIIPVGRPGRRMMILAAVATSMLFAAVLFSPLGERLPGASAATSLATRRTMLSNGFEAFGTFAPIGSGFGTFPKIYRLFEEPDQVDRTYVNHAHNDYLELAIETGVPGLILIVLFLGWWLIAVGRMLRSPAAGVFAFAGAIGSASILLHSMVDYPMRTAAISSLFAACLALIISRRTAASENDIRPTRHLVID